MKILHLSNMDIQGGAYRGTYWLHQGLLEAGVESLILVGKKLSDDFSVIGPESKLAKGINQLKPTLDQLPLLFYKNRLPYPFSPSWIPSKISEKIKKIKPDIINLHWICAGFLPIESLAKFNDIPIVWTIRDMWPFTGGCHYSGNCTKYHHSCGGCPCLNSNKEKDLSRDIWKRKQRSWQDLNLTVVSISHWLADCAKQSSLFRGKRIEVIPNALNETQYKPIPQNIAREILNLTPEKKIILFGAINATKDERKGFPYLVSALNKLSARGFGKTTELVIFGASQPKEPLDLGMKAHYMGNLYDDITLALTYSAADVTVVPSIQEAFGKTAMESLACGTPVVCFDSTGLKDIVEHQKNGYRSKCFSSEDLADGIAWVLQDDQRWQILSQRGREKVEQEFTLKKQASKYLELYTQILNT